jgi:hypothetical protein
MEEEEEESRSEDSGEAQARILRGGSLQKMSSRVALWREAKRG